MHVSSSVPPTDPEGVGWSLREDACPLAGATSVDITTGEVAWVPSCKNARCEACSRRVSSRTFALARRAADLETEHFKRWVRFLTLTQAPDGWEATRQAVKSWLLHLRREGYEMHVLWVVERGENKTPEHPHGMKHIHVIQRGDFIPKAVLEASWPYGSTQIAAAKQAASDYLAKGVIPYVAKGLDSENREVLEAHMNLNGGRAAHWSRGFFHGVSRDDFAAAFPIPGRYFVEVVR